MKKIVSLIIISLLCSSMLPLLAPKARAEPDVVTLPAGAWHPYWRQPDWIDSARLDRIDLDPTISGDQQIVTVGPGAEVTIDYSAWLVGNPGEIRQLWFVYSWASSYPPWDAYTPVYNGQPYPSRTVANSFSIATPITPGTYKVWLCVQSQYNMNDAVADVTEEPTMSSHAIITVIGTVPVLYAGGSDPGVVYRYISGTDWEVISPALGYAVLSLIEYNGHLYAGTTSEYGGSNGIGQVYRYDGGTNWTIVGDNMDHDVCSLAVYQGHLYAGTAWNGMKLYRYEGGTTWTQVIDSVVWYGTRCLYASHDYLLMGDVQWDYIGHWDGATFHQDQPSTTGSCIYDFQDYEGHVYGAAYGGRLWRSNDAIHWSVVLDYYDGNIWELEEFQNRVYMSYNNGELRAYEGVGDLRGGLVYTAPDGIISMTTDGNYLYFGTGGDAVGFGSESSGMASVYTYDGTSVVRISDEDEMVTGVQVLYVLGALEDVIPPTVSNVRHEPLYPTSADEIFFYADVTDNVAVSQVQLNYTEDGGATWLLKDMTLLEGITYTTSLGPYPTRKIIGFYVIAYDEAGNKGIGSEIVPPIPEPPRVAPILISDEYPVPLPEGEDVWYTPTDSSTIIYVDVGELGLYLPELLYYISYSIDGGLTWITEELTQISDYIWKYIIPSLTNILFKIETSDGRSSIIYWIIIAPWKYPIYLYFSTEEQYYPVKGLDFDYEQTGNYDITNNKESYDNYFASYRPGDLDNDGFPDVPAYAYMNPKTLDDGCLVIEYWIYYAFNDYFYLDKHEHDFESVYLWIDVATGNIKKIALNQHTWVNHYFLNVPPTRRINIAVELGGHGMQLLADSDANGLPDEGLLGEYVRASPYEYPILTLPMMDHWWTINKDSFVAQLFPWTIFDPRVSQNETHLFGDPAILTVGLATFFPFPHLMQDSSGSLDETATQEMYAYILDLIGSPTLLKTDYALTIPGLGGALAFLVSAPWYRKEFTEPRLEWNKADFRFWLGRLVGKIALKIAISYITGGMFAAVETAIARGILVFAAGWSLDRIINWLIDPISGTVIDECDNVLGYVDGDIVCEVPGSYIFTTRSMTYDLYDLFFVLTNSTEGYIYEVRGIDPVGTYNFTVSCKYDDGKELSFSVVEIPILSGEIHRYIINWTLLEDEEPCVEVGVDEDGDGTPEHEFMSDDELTGEEFEEATADDIPPTTNLIIGEPKYVDAMSNTFVTSTTSFTLIGEDNPGGTGVASTSYRIYDDSYDTGWLEYSVPFYLAGLPDDGYSIDYYSTDNIGNSEPTNTADVILDNTAPEITVSNPPASWALQDGVTFTGSVVDARSGVFSMSFSIRKANDGEGVPIGYEDLPVSYDPNTGEWSFSFDTLLVPDGYYVLYIEAEDNLGNEASNTVPYSIRYWAVIELLPSSEDNKAGRTMPVKFALRVAAEVDPNQPFVYNEELRIEIFATTDPNNILQASYYGDTARDYRISSVLYIANFKTIKKSPMKYTVAIYRDTFDVGSFTFETLK